MSIVLILISVVFLGQVATTVGWCSGGCVCEKRNSTMTCTSARLPIDLPENITAVYIKNFHSVKGHHGIFKGPNKKKLKFLDIHNEKDMILYKYSFLGLKRLQHLRIHSHHRLFLQQNAFAGLYRIEILDISHNYIQQSRDGNFDLFSTDKATAFDVAFFNRRIRQSLSTLDLSGSSLSSVWSLHTLTSLQMINLSSNCLSHMQVHQASQFSALLSSSAMLHEVYLSGNRLTNLPENFFVSNTQLEYLDLSYNFLDSLTFKFLNLTRLKFMDLSSNRITVLDQSILARLDMLNNLVHGVHESDRNDKSATTNIRRVRRNFHARKFSERFYTDYVMPINRERFQVSLESNPFECTCSREQIQFMLWLRTSPSIDRDKLSYTCTLDGCTMNILMPEVKVQDFCTLQIHFNILKMCIPVALTVIVVSISSALYILQQMLKNQQYQTLLKELRSDTYRKKFLVFLAYCLEDADFVLTQIYPDLHTTLSKLSKSKRNLVCTGDGNFHPGRFVTMELVRCIDDAAVVMFVVSNTFCTKGGCEMEVNEAYSQQKPIIILKMEQVDKGRMSRVFSTIFNRYTQVTWVGSEAEGRLEPDVQTICSFILKLACHGGDHFFSKYMPFKRAVPTCITSNKRGLQTV